MRFIALWTTFWITAVWVCACIIARTIVDIPTGVVVFGVSVILGKTGQSIFGECSNGGRFSGE